MCVLVLTKRQYTNKDLLDERFGRLRELPLGLGRRGHDVRGLCLSYEAREEGWIRDEAVWWKSLNATPMKIPGLVRFIREAASLAPSCDVIWAGSDSFYGVIGYLIGRRIGVPMVFDLYDNFESFLAARLPVMKQLYRYVVRHCAALTCVSRPLAALIETRGRVRAVHVLENAVRNDIFKPLEKDRCRAELGLPATARIVGTAGALDDNRGIKVLFEAFRRLGSTHPDLHLAVAGRRKRSLAIPVDPRVHDFGDLAHEKVPVFLNALDVAVVCNLDNDFGRYCFPQKAHEIMACDVPVIAADTGVMSELLHPHPEWLFKPGCATSLARVLEDRLTDRSTAYAPAPTWPDLAETLERVMLEAINAKSNRKTQRKAEQQPIGGAGEENHAG